MNSSQQNKPQLLVVLSRFPYPLQKGDKLRAYYQLVELSKRYSITLFAVSDRRVPKRDLEEVEKYCNQVVVHYLSPAQRLFNLFIGLFSEWPFQVHYFFSIAGRNKVQQLIQEQHFEHIYCQLVRSAEYVKNIHHIPKTIDYMDALSAGIERRIKGRKWYDKWLFRLESKRLKKYERKIFDFFEHHTIISKQDRLLIAHPEQQRIHAIPNGISTHFFEELERTEQFDFVFVGNMAYPPNIDAVKYIAKHILPAFPERRLLISGATPHHSVERLVKSNSQIEMTGWVEDIRTSYLNGKLFLAPMTIGTGMQNKLLEAMALKTPCITTDLANNAIGTEHETHILVGNTPDEIIKQIKMVLNAPAKRVALAESAQHFVREHYSWQKTTELLMDIMAQKPRKHQ